MDGFPGKAAGIEVNLRCNDHPVPGHIALQCFSQVFFAGTGGVSVGGIKKIDTLVQGMVDDLRTLPFIQSPVMHGTGLAEAHAADTEFGYPTVRMSQFCIFHE